MKTKLFATITMYFLIMNCFSQDIIIKLTGDTIRVKVIEVGSTEIKYKKIDNQTGPTYSILKSDVYFIKYENGTSDEITKIEPRQFEGNMGKIILMRKNGYSGSKVVFEVSVDDSLVCKLKSNCYSEHLIKPGEHKISLTGNKFTVSQPITINIYPGRITYILLTTKTNFTTFDIKIEKVSDNMAKTILPEIKPIKKCQ